MKMNGERFVNGERKRSEAERASERTVNTQKYGKVECFRDCISRKLHIIFMYTSSLVLEYLGEFRFSYPQSKVLLSIILKLLCLIFWSLQYQIIFNTNQLAQEVRLNISHIYTSRISILSNIEMFKVNKNNFTMGTQKMHHGCVYKREPFELSPNQLVLFNLHIMHRL